jgi:hypothetical protein
LLAHPFQSFLVWLVNVWSQKLYREPPRVKTAQEKPPQDPRITLACLDCVWHIRTGAPQSFPGLVGLVRLLPGVASSKFDSRKKRSPTPVPPICERLKVKTSHDKPKSLWFACLGCVWHISILEAPQSFLVWLVNVWSQNSTEIPRESRPHKRSLPKIRESLWFACVWVVFGSLIVSHYP